MEIKVYHHRRRIARHRTFASLDAAEIYIDEVVHRAGSLLGYKPDKTDYSIGELFDFDTNETREERMWHELTDKTISSASEKQRLYEKLSGDV